MSQEIIFIHLTSKEYWDETMARLTNSRFDKEKSIPLVKGMSLYHALQKAEVFLSVPCGGKGTCGGCKVKVLEGDISITQKDRECIICEELEAGWRLACQMYPTEECSVYVPYADWMALTSYEVEDGRKTEYDGMSDDEIQSTRATEVIEKCPETNYDKSKDANEQDSKCREYGIAVDLGTTTLAYELFDIHTKRTVQSLSATNPQRMFGADVISRIEQSNNGRRDLLKHTLRQELRKNIRTLTEGMDENSISLIGVSGNITMLHLLMGYSCEGLGRYPFKPVTLESIATNAKELGIGNTETSVFLMGGISAYVGGDILTGLSLYEKEFQTKKCLFIDLGTNAEMVASDGKGKFYVTSAPAGPAFEAANISCGVGSIVGAVFGVETVNGEHILSTIGNKEAVGFCGSGILEAVYELRKNNCIDETGLLAEPYFENGYPMGKLKITRQDIRQIQLAKSAVISAIEILLTKAGVTQKEIDTVYLAGGFGYFLNVEKAMGIGLLPKEFLGKIKTVGNASLHGMKEFLCQISRFAERVSFGDISEKRILEAEDESITAIKRNCEEIYLSNEPKFRQIFVENMNL